MHQASGTACLPGSLACLAEISCQYLSSSARKGSPGVQTRCMAPPTSSRTGSPSRHGHPGGPHCLGHHATYSRILKSETPPESGSPPEWPVARTSTPGPRWELASHPCFLSPLASDWLPTSILLCLNLLTPGLSVLRPWGRTGVQRCRLWHLQFSPMPGCPETGRSLPESQPPLESSCPECEVFPHLGRGQPPMTPQPPPHRHLHTGRVAASRATALLQGQTPPIHPPPLHLTPCKSASPASLPGPTYTPSTSADFFRSTIWMSRAPAGMWVTRE